MNPESHQPQAPGHDSHGHTSHGHQHGHSSHSTLEIYHPPLMVYILVFVALLVLVAVTIGVAGIELGPLNFLVALSIASIKAVLIVLYFMHVRWSSRLVWIFAGAGFLWLGLLVFMTLNDYFTRGPWGLHG
jgi:cytochrome c oxidase subunit IV